MSNPGEFDMLGSSGDDPDLYAIKKPNTSAVKLNHHSRNNTPALAKNEKDPESDFDADLEQVPYQPEIQEIDMNDEVFEKDQVRRRATSKQKYNNRKSSYYTSRIWTFWV